MPKPNIRKDRHIYIYVFSCDGANIRKYKRFGCYAKKINNVRAVLSFNIGTRNLPRVEPLMALYPIHLLTSCIVCTTTRNTNFQFMC